MSRSMLVSLSALVVLSFFFNTGCTVHHHYPKHAGYTIKVEKGKQGDEAKVNKHAKTTTTKAMKTAPLSVKLGKAKAPAQPLRIKLSKAMAPQKLKRIKLGKKAAPQRANKAPAKKAAKAAPQRANKAPTKKAAKASKPKRLSPRAAALKAFQKCNGRNAKPADATKCLKAYRAAIAKVEKAEKRKKRIAARARRRARARRAYNRCTRNPLCVIRRAKEKLRREAARLVERHRQICEAAPTTPGCANAKKGDRHLAGRRKK